jgi:hypothetical protein
MADDPVETPEAPAPAPQPQANGSDGDELGRLFAEYDERTGSTSKPTPSADDGDPLADIPDAQPQQPQHTLPAPTHSQEVLAMMNYLLGIERDRQTERDRADEVMAINSIRGDIGKEVYSDDMVAGWINGIAKSDERVQSAWKNRHAEPEKYQRVVASLGRRFRSEQVGNLPDRDATADRAAVTAAVRGASTRQPEAKPPDFSRMSDAEARDAIQKQHGYTPNF